MLSVKKFKEITQRINELNDGWIPDWSDDNDEAKYVLNFDHINDRFQIDEYYWTQYNSLVFKSKDLAKQMIEEYDDKKQDLIDFLNSDIDLSNDVNVDVQNININDLINFLQAFQSVVPERETIDLNKVVQSMELIFKKGNK